MIKAQGMVPEGEGFNGERLYTPLPQDLVTEIGAKGQILNPVGSVTKQSSDVAGFKQQPPDQVTNHRRPDKLMMPHITEFD